MFARRHSQQLTKLLYRKTCVARDSSHCQRVHRIVPWYRKDPNPVGYDNVFALTNDAEACFLECPNRLQVVDAGYLGHDSAYDLDLPDLGISQKFVPCFKILLDGVLNIG